MRDSSTQTTDQALSAPLQGETTAPFEKATLDLMLDIFELLDSVSLLSLKCTSAQLYQAINSNGRFKACNPSHCARGKIRCSLEKDTMFSQAPGVVHLPKLIQCTICKKRHPQKAFGNPHADVKYGIECLRAVLPENPLTRYCWLHVPKRFNYSPRFRDNQQKLWARALPCYRWVTTRDLVCMHCGDRVQKHPVVGEEECPTCPGKCDVCWNGATLLMVTQLINFLAV